MLEYRKFSEGRFGDGSSDDSESGRSDDSDGGRSVEVLPAGDTNVSGVETDIFPTRGM